MKGPRCLKKNWRTRHTKLFSRKNYINNISFLLLAIVSFLFIVKYASRGMAFPVLFGGLFLVLFYFMVSSIVKIDFKNHKFFNTRTYLLACVFLCIGLIIALRFITPETRAGRHIALNGWLDNLKYGFYPYDSKANPSGFPFLFALALPFYIIGDAGYLAVFGIILFLSILRNASSSLKELYARFFIFLVLPVVYYEFVVRSELFTNMTLIIALIAIALKKINPEKADFNFVSIAFLFGLFLSTRLIVFPVYLLFLLYFFRRDIFKGIIFVTISFSAFILTLLPFVIWNQEYFWRNGPFAIQFSYLPLWLVIIAPFILAYIGWMIRDAQELMFASGATVFTLVTASLAVKSVECGLYACIVNSCFDISYFALATPFLILSISDYKVDRYLGKILG
jgi:hypothetical protein